MPLLEATGVTVAIGDPADDARAVRAIDLRLGAGETLGLVGESGCGKTLTAYALLGLLPPNLSAAGTLRFDGVERSLAEPDSLRPLRGGEVAMVSQDPLTALNPVARIERQLSDVMERHLGLSRRARRSRALELLERVGFPSPRRVADAYPFELSGGMRQRVLIAMAISCRPKLLIADEPTTALDTTVQAQIMDLLAGLVAEEGLAMLLITHDLGLVAEHCAQVNVMYAGRIVERGTVQAVLERPAHPYARALVKCLASLDAGDDMLETIPGSVPAVHEPVPGCRFAPRCAFAEAGCRAIVPELRQAAHGGDVACLRSDELALPALDLDAAR